MAFLVPDPASYDRTDWANTAWHDRVRLACDDWVVGGFGAPVATYLFYVVKTVLYVGGWYLFVTSSDAVSGGIGDWWLTTVAFQKAIVWTMLWESAGLGAGSGPLSGRYFPPATAAAHFLWPGTIRLPPFPERLPFTAGHRRTSVDAALYAAFVVGCVVALLADTVGVAQVLPVVVVLGVLGLRDKTVFLAARSEHYLTTLVVFLLANSLGGTGETQVIAGSKAVAVGIWWWAATSKLNAHFPAVLAVMLSNHPLNRLRRMREALFVDPPGDVRPSRIPHVLAHAGTAIEYLFPLLLLFGGGGPVTTIGLVVMVAFHGYIISSVPLGVPIEWNVVVLYAGFVLFTGDNADVLPWQVSPLLGLVLLLALVVVPAYGNARPDKVSFLPSMRYYAGNWAFSTYLLKPGMVDRIDERVTKVADDVTKQVQRFYEPEVGEVALTRVMGFRSMHLHGRLLGRLVAQAVDDPRAHDLRDGEVMCGVTVGYNFGDGHLHNEQLLRALQAECNFGPGDVVAVFVESEPALRRTGRGTMHWRIVDAHDGLREEGWEPVANLLGWQPWPDGPDSPRLVASTHTDRRG